VTCCFVVCGVSAKREGERCQHRNQSEKWAFPFLKNNLNQRWWLWDRYWKAC